MKFALKSLNTWKMWCVDLTLPVRIPHEDRWVSRGQSTLCSCGPQRWVLKDVSRVGPTWEAGTHVPELSPSADRHLKHRREGKRREVQIWWRSNSEWHLYLRQHWEPASRVGIVGRVVGWRDDRCVERRDCSDTVWEPPVGQEELGRILQLLLIRGAQVGGAEEGHDGVTHVPDTPAHCGLPHTEQRADGAVLDVGRQAPQSHRHALLHRQRQAEAGVLAGQAGPQLLAEVEERLPAHAELVQPVGRLEFSHHDPLPPIGGRSGGPGSCADADVGADPSCNHHLEGRGARKSLKPHCLLFTFPFLTPDNFSYT